MTAEPPTEAQLPDRITGMRPIRAQGPGSELEALRRAYLDLLKLSVCDLVGARTGSVEGLPGGLVASKELVGQELRIRSEGRDWPLHALTMTGLRRLDDLERCVEQISREGVPGDLLEAGAWRGGSSMLMRATLDTLGETERTVWVADSFEGFPLRAEEDRHKASEPTLEPFLAAFDFLAAPLPEVRANFVRLGVEEGTRFVPGFVEQTLPALRGRSWALIRLDSDTYDSTLLALRCLYPGLAPGGFLIVDDYHDLDECRAAVDQFRREMKITDPIEKVDWACVRWRRGSSGTPAAVDTEEIAAPVRLMKPPNRPKAHGRVPTIEELELARQSAELRERLAEAEAELARLRASATSGRRLRDRLRRVLRT